MYPVLFHLGGIPIEASGSPCSSASSPRCSSRAASCSARPRPRRGLRPDSVGLRRRLRRRAAVSGAHRLGRLSARPASSSCSPAAAGSGRAGVIGGAVAVIVEVARARPAARRRRRLRRAGARHRPGDRPHRLPARRRRRLRRSPTDLPWGMSYPNGVVPTTRDASTRRRSTRPCCTSPIFIVLWRQRDRPHPPGSLFGQYLVLSGVVALRGRVRAPQSVRRARADPRRNG